MANLSLCEYFALFALLAFFTAAQGEAVKSERDLRQDLFRNYDKNARPVTRASTQVSIATSMKPLSLGSMDEKEQMIVLDSYMILTWTDEYLKWDPSEYDNITQLQVPSSDIWKPDLALYTASPDTSTFPVVEVRAIAYNTGMIVWAPPFTIMSRCPLPFKKYVTNRSFVTCNIRIGSWTYSGPLMDVQLSSETVDVTDFTDVNPDWKLVNVVASRESKYYPCCPEAYPLLHFNVTLKKRDNYFNPKN